VNNIDVRGNLKALTIHNREDNGYVTGILDDKEFLLCDNLSQPHDFIRGCYTIFLIEATTERQAFLSSFTSEGALLAFLSPKEHGTEEEKNA